MTVIDLYPEPPVGSKVRDNINRLWEHDRLGWIAAGMPWHRSWYEVFIHAPLTLIEPEPWPTAPLIVADWKTVTDSGRGLLTRARDRYYRTTTEGYYIREDSTGANTLTNVVPGTVVPVDPYTDTVKALDHWMRTGAAADAVDVAVRFSTLAVSTDALGLDR